MEKLSKNWKKRWKNEKIKIIKITKKENLVIGKINPGEREKNTEFCGFYPEFCWFYPEAPKGFF